jgi:hypothetical protein
MSEVDLNKTVNGYRGSIGRLVFRKYKGRTIVGRKPVSSKPPTPAQIAHRERFKEAVAFGKSAMADPTLREFYEEIAAKEGKSAFAAARRLLYQERFAVRDMTPLAQNHRTSQKGGSVTLRHEMKPR